MKNYPQRALNWVLDLVFPKICLGCGKFTAISDFDYICKKCFGAIELKNVFECIGCKRQTRLGLTCVFCKKDNDVDQLLVAAELTDYLVEKMLKAYKYKFVYDMVIPLSVIAKKCVKRLLSKGFNLFEDNPLIVSVPLHKIRLNKRGFNQSQLLAKEMSDSFHISCADNALARKYNPRNQADTKTREERLHNVRDNFVVIDAEVVRGRTVILVDDICTTGATLNEGARVLKESEAKRVIGFVVARGKFRAC